MCVRERERERERDCLKNKMHKKIEKKWGGGCHVVLTYVWVYPNFC